MQVYNSGVNSYTGRAGNTWYWGGAGVSNEAGTRGAGVAGLAFDQGSDGTIDAGIAVGGAAGPRGAIGGVAGFGPNHHGAALAATNGETTRTWSRFV